MTNTKNHHYYEKLYIGSSDRARLYVIGGVKKAITLRFLEDGDYTAYIVDNNADIPNSYKLVAEFDKWIDIYNDEGIQKSFTADKIRIYRRGVFGCIIKLEGKKDD